MSLADLAWDSFKVQHAGKPRTEAFVRSFYGPLDALQDASQALLDQRGPLTAQGVQLDGVGQIVGIGRQVDEAVFGAFFGFQEQTAGRAFGVARIRRDGEPWASSDTLNDDDYRKRILLKIALNNAHGTARDIAIAVRAAYGPGIKVTVADAAAVATVHVFIGFVFPEADPTWRLATELLPRAGGVTVIPLFYDPADPSEIFDIAGDPVAGVVVPT